MIILLKTLFVVRQQLLKRFLLATVMLPFLGQQRFRNKEDTTHSNISTGNNVYTYKYLHIYVST